MSESPETQSGNGGTPPNSAINEAALEAERKTRYDVASEINQRLKAATPLVTNQDITYTFKSPRKDKDGKPPIDPETGLELTARPQVKLTVPVPTWDGIVAFITDEKNTPFILDLFADLVKDAAKAQVYDDANPVNTQHELDLNKLTLDYIASQPKSERTGRGIPKETWAEFVQDYIDVMVPLTSRSVEKVTDAAKLLASRLATVKTSKPVIKFLTDQLNMWMAATPNKEEFGEVYQFLKTKADTYMNMTDQDLLNNLQ